MAAYEILVTDVTNYGTLYCVAGTTIDGRMIRPEPHTAKANNEVSRFWTDAAAGPGKFFSVGNIVSFEAEDPPGNFPYPHATEDRLVVAGEKGRVIKSLDYAEIAKQAAPSLSQSLNDAFGGNVVVPASKKPYVLKDTQSRSLGAIETDAACLEFHVNDYKPDKPKLRAYLQDAGIRYNLPVTADDIHRAWRAKGVTELNDALRKCGRAHVRLGLSRPFPAQPVECYVQINGIFFA